jgi:hypothetical protein
MSVLDRLIRRKVEEVVKQVIDERLPAMVAASMAKTFARHPDCQLTKAGFEWAFIIAINDRWPATPADICRLWLWDYLDARYGAPGYAWTARAARLLADQYVSEFGEVAA